MIGKLSPEWAIDDSPEGATAHSCGRQPAELRTPCAHKPRRGDRRSAFHRCHPYGASSFETPHDCGLTPAAKCCRPSGADDLAGGLI